MAQLPIITAPDPRLKIKARPVRAVDDRIRRLMDDMLDTMYGAIGIGLAAPQVEQSSQVIVLDVAREGEKPQPLKLANPEILLRSPELASMREPVVAARTVGALIEAGHRTPAVYEHAPRAAGGGHRPQPSPVQSLAAQHGLPVRFPAPLRNEAEQAAFAALGTDAAVVAAYGLILPRAILTAPRLGCLNLHASLLPPWRGAPPIQRALLAGDRETGITIMQMEEG